MSAPVPSPSLSLLCGGDVAPVRQPVDALADHVQPLLDSVDFRFLQCERTYSQRGAFPDWQTIPPGRWSRLDEDYASVFKAAKADVVSLASNHALDFGWDALEDTIALSGYLLRSDGHGPLAFSLFFNGVAGKQDVARRAADRFVEALARDY